MNTKSNPEGTAGFPPFPSPFEIPQEFRQTIPVNIQRWLADIERRIDGLTLDVIEKEAEQYVRSEFGDEFGSEWAEPLYRLGRRAFYTRMQQIVDIMFPGQGIEVGIDLLWGQTTNDLPGSAVTTAVVNGEGLNTGCVRQLKKAGFKLQGSWVDDQADWWKSCTA